MANFDLIPSAGNMTLKARPGIKKLIPWAVGAALLLAIAIGAVTAASRERPADDAGSPALESSVAPEIGAQAPPDMSWDLAAQSIRRRDGFPMLSWDVTKFSTGVDGRVSYSGAPTRTGIDVSEHQGEINWKKVVDSGIDFAMLRLGYRGSTAGSLYTDEYFEKNIAGATAAGIPIGVYFYSQAITVEEAKEEARFVIENLGDYKLDYPVVYDWEIVGGIEARTYSVSRQTLCACTRAFCDEIKAAGYKPMIYFTRYLGYRKHILRNLTDYSFWYAEYGDRPRFAFDFDMWQYSETGLVDGIAGNVDLNLYFPRA